MSLSEMSRTPFSLVDEINQVPYILSPKLNLNMIADYHFRVWINVQSERCTISLWRLHAIPKLDSELHILNLFQ